MPTAALIIAMLKSWRFTCKGKGKTIQGVVAYIDLMKLVGYEAPRKENRETQSSFWTFVKHNSFMKYIFDKGHVKCTYKGWTEGTVTLAWVPRGLLGCTGVHSTISVTNKVHQNTFLHSVQEEFHEHFSDYTQDDLGTKCLWVILFPF